MSYQIYKIIHVVGLAMIMLGLGGLMFHALGGEKKHDGRRGMMMTHGGGLFLVILGGFGMLARKGIHWPWPGWDAEVWPLDRSRHRHNAALSQSNSQSGLHLAPSWPVWLSVPYSTSTHFSSWGATMRQVAGGNSLDHSSFPFASCKETVSERVIGSI